MIDPQTAALLIVSVLGLATAFAFVHSKAALIAHRDEVRSRAEIVREVKQIRMHRPSHLVMDDKDYVEFWKEQ